MAVNKLGRYAKAQALEAVLRKTQSPAANASGMWWALCTSATVASDAGLTMADASFTEYTAAGGYARQQVPMGSATSASPSVIANSGTVTWGPFTTGTGAIIRYVVVVDGASGTGSNVIAVIQLTADRTPASGDSLQAAAAALTVSID